MERTGIKSFLNRQKYTVLWALTVVLFYGICVTLYILGHESFIYPALGGLVLHQVSRKAFTARGFRTKMLVTGVLLLIPCLFLVAEHLAKKEYGLKQVSEFGIVVGLSLLILSLLGLAKPFLQQKLEKIKFFSVDAKWKRILLILGGGLAIFLVGICIPYVSLFTIFSGLGIYIFSNFSDYYVIEFFFLLCLLYPLAELVRKKGGMPWLSYPVLLTVVLALVYNMMSISISFTALLLIVPIAILGSLVCDIACGLITKNKKSSESPPPSESPIPET